MSNFHFLPYLPPKKSHINGKVIAFAVVSLNIFPASYSIGHRGRRIKPIKTIQLWRNGLPKSWVQGQVKSSQAQADSKSQFLRSLSHSKYSEQARFKMSWDLAVSPLFCATFAFSTASFIQPTVFPSTHAGLRIDVSC